MIQDGGYLIVYMWPKVKEERFYPFASEKPDKSALNEQISVETLQVWWNNYHAGKTSLGCY